MAVAIGFLALQPMLGRLLCRVAVGAIALALPHQTAQADQRARMLDTLIRAYPAQLVRHDGDRIYWRDGTAMLVSDSDDEKPIIDQLLRQASILDQLRLPYPRGPLKEPPQVNAGPGRFRNEAFFLKMYRDCRKREVQQRIVPIGWLPKAWNHRIEVTSDNGIAEKLIAVSTEIDELPGTIKQAAYPVTGVWSCRSVADTGRLSMHAFGAAIDLNVGDYWLWQKRREAAQIAYRNQMPPEIVDIFERHGFIWGGKWYHYDYHAFRISARTA